MTESPKFIIDDELACSDNSVFLVNRSLEVIYNNTTAEEIFCQNLTEPVKKLDFILGKSNTDKLIELLPEAENTDFPVEICEFSRIIDKNTKSYKIFCREVQQNKGIFRVIVVETSRIQDNISKSIQKKKLQTLGKLTSSIAHEINSPLQYVSDNVKFMENGFSRFSSILRIMEANDFYSDDNLKSEFEEKQIAFFKGEIPEAIDHTIEGLTRITEIIKAIKEFSHPGWSEKNLININKMLRMTTILMRNKWKYNIDIHFDLDKALPDFYGYVSEMNQVFANIINNAIDAINEIHDLKKKGNIYISTSWNYKWINVEIKNDGPLIPQATLRRMFKNFFTTKDVGHGTGQGLSLCKNIIEKHHYGEIEAVSSMEEMTKFTIHLPVNWEELEGIE